MRAMVMVMVMVKTLEMVTVMRLVGDKEGKGRGGKGNSEDKESGG